MPHFEIKILNGKTEAQKKELAAAVIKAAQAIIGFGEESYFVTIEDFSMDEWKRTVYPQDIMGRKEIIYKKPGYTM